jgi:capsular exopolysaccharide synthesis family protein
MRQPLVRDDLEGPRPRWNDGRGAAIPAVPPASGDPRPSPTPAGEIDERLVTLLRPSSYAAEQYLPLRHAVERLRTNRGLSVIAITSPSVHDGKTTTALNLAGALAQAPGARVLLVEADLRRPSVTARLALGEAAGPGLVALVADRGLRLADAVRRRGPFRVDALPAGPACPSPHGVLESPRLGELLDEARRGYDFVVVDTPPLVPVLDCRIIDRWVDGFFLVVAAHRTPRTLVAEALAVLEPSRVLGVVFNGDDRAASGYRAAYGAPHGPPHGPSWWRRLIGKTS